MKRHISYPSINQFHRTVENVKHWAEFHQCPLPTIRFIGSVKFHGTNVSIAAELNKGDAGEIWPQSREHVLDERVDTTIRFLPYYRHNEIAFGRMVAHATRLAEPTAQETHLTIFGEWMGPSIFSGTGVGKLPHRFMIFGVRIEALADDSNEPTSSRWLSDAHVSQVARTGRLEEAGAMNFCVYDIAQWKIAIDFNDLETAQAELQRLTDAVADHCPGAQFFGAEGVGEGLVWQVDPHYACPLPERQVRFKTVGKRHTNGVTRSARELSPFELEQQKKTREFAEELATEARLTTIKNRLIQSGVEVTERNVGEFLKAFSIDCHAEQEDRAEQLELVWKEVAKQLANLAKSYWREQVKSAEDQIDADLVKELGIDYGKAIKG